MAGVPGTGGVTSEPGPVRDYLRDMVTRSHAHARYPGPGRHTDPSTRHSAATQLWRSLRQLLHSCWEDGWLPLDLSRTVTRHPTTGKDFGELPHLLLRDLIAQDLAGYAPATVDPRFTDQLALIEARVWWSASEQPLRLRMDSAAREGRTEEQAWEHVMESAMRLFHLMSTMPPLQPLCPPPGRAEPGGPHQDRTPADERVLEKVRLLLAKAESTPYEAEAETFTAGAQSLMARHSIDAAMLAARAPATGRSGPQTTRIHVFAPYEQPKVALLAAIGQANRCRCVWHENLGCASVVGFAADLLAVEALFTSLLVQGTTAMQRHGSRVDGSGRSRTRAFRSTFLNAFAVRIGERLQSVSDAETTQAQTQAGKGDLLPVLAARQEQIEEVFAQQFPGAVASRRRFVADREGWHAGRAAADNADLARGGRLSGG